MESRLFTFFNDKCKTLLDFDGTITTITPREGNPTSFDALFLSAGDEVKKDYLKKRDLTLPEREKWDSVLKLGIGLHYRNVNNAAQELKPREGSIDFLENLYYAKRPFYIVSAGIGNVIDEFFDIHISNPLLKDYIMNHTIANYYSYSENLVLNTLPGPLVHAKNKGAFFLGHDLLERFPRKSLVIGDSKSDASMIPNAYPIGICDREYTSDKTINEMQKYFNVIILDGTFNFLNALLE